eukprot:scaffold103159_cov17-Tisochrysis_lutea.AAC.2
MKPAAAQGQHKGSSSTKAACLPTSASCLGLLSELGSSLRATPPGAACLPQLFDVWDRPEGS